MSNPIIGKRLTIITKSGRRIDYTHITLLSTTTGSLIVHGETDGAGGMRVNAIDAHKLDGLHVVIFEPYIPPE